MDPTYFERLHRQEARDAEWRMLNEVLQPARSERWSRPNLRWLRRAVGRWLITIGTHIAGPAATEMPCACLEDGTVNQTCLC